MESEKKNCSARKENENENENEDKNGMRRKVEEEESGVRMT